MTDSSEIERHVQRPGCLPIVEAVADREGVDPSHLDPPLYQVVDPEALETLVGSGGRPGDHPVTVQFEYAGYRVVVESDGTLEVE